MKKTFCDGCNIAITEMNQYKGKITFPVKDSKGVEQGIMSVAFDTMSADADFCLSCISSEMNNAIKEQKKAQSCFDEANTPIPKEGE